jgi:hypothetical protein
MLIAKLSRRELLLAIASQTLLSTRSKLFRAAKLSCEAPSPRAAPCSHFAKASFEVAQRRVALKQRAVGASFESWCVSPNSFW